MSTRREWWIIDSPMSKPKVREIWLVYDAQEKAHVEVPALFVNQPLAKKYGKPFRVCEWSPEAALAGSLYDNVVKLRTLLKSGRITFTADMAASLEYDAIVNELAKTLKHIEQSRSQAEGGGKNG